VSTRSSDGLALTKEWQVRLIGMVDRIDRLTLQFVVEVPE